jgi:hypothetical protein
MGKRSRLHRQAVIRGEEIPYVAAQRQVVRYTQAELIDAPLLKADYGKVIILEKPNGMVEYLTPDQALSFQDALKFRREIVLAKIKGLVIVSDRRQLEGLRAWDLLNSVKEILKDEK